MRRAISLNTELYLPGRKGSGHARKGIPSVP